METTKEIAIQILDLFEDLLEENDIYIPDDDRTGDESEACIYGITYYDLEDDICEILQKYITEERS